MSDQPRGMFSIRTFVILLAALVFGLLAGLLCFLTSDSLPEAAMYSVGVFGASLVVLHQVIEKPSAH